MEDGKYLNGAQREYLVPKAYSAALRAGAAILDVYRRKGDFEVDLKRDLTPVTEADRQAHSVIKEYLGRTHVPVLSEEGREMRFDERRDWDMFWLVDPLDGTKEFIKGNNEFTVNIALVVNNRPVVGVIFVPYFQKIYFCEKGHGSFMKEGVASDPEAELTYDEVFAGAVALPLHRERNNPLRIAVSRSHKNDDTTAHVALLRERFPDAEVVEQGSSYKFCLLAEGAIDYYVRTSGTYEWDTAAGEIILSDTGGTTKSLPDLGKFAYNKESLLNPWFACRSAHFQE
ncbi:MAG: 3'(2'),5'-bisphosphate nucleotidase CysQ [Alistipes sp.]|jgi:3'(2'), 5'-bisphosphate nucleotidase|nr:3'(2'),5'-bisphosphate nucleotidase CysQ [Alistipes sp.]